MVLYLAYKYGPDDPAKALLQNVMIGGHSTARGAVLGAILGAFHKEIPFADGLCQGCDWRGSGEMGGSSVQSLLDLVRVWQSTATPLSITSQL